MTNNMFEMLERFYICSNLPIVAFGADGNFLASSGYNERFKDIFEENHILDKVMEWTEKDDIEGFISVSCGNKTYFTACFIDEFQKGVYILGPHTCLKNNEYKIPYKPRCYMESLVSLLNIIEKDLNKRKSKRAYSYHIRKGLDYLDNRYSDNITLDEVSQFLNINKSYFCSLLKKETGKTFTHILNTIRIEKSKKLLNKDNSSILDIALAVGFNNQNYYNIMFKKVTGMTPLEFRNGKAS